MRIGIITSGGDAPGMNAVIKGLVEANEDCGNETVGIVRGYNGLFNKEYRTLTGSDVRHIYPLGGTFLLAGRNEWFKTGHGREVAVREIKRLGLDVLIVIGGDGSIYGASLLSRMGVNVIAIPASIDNDIYDSDYSIGYDTCLNVVIDSLDRIRDTAVSHDRTHVVEVMGRECGLIALHGGQAAFAEYILLPGVSYDLRRISEGLQKRRSAGHLDHLIVVAEGAGEAKPISEAITRLSGIKTTSTVLGQIQRGGRPTARERIMARKFVQTTMAAINNQQFNVLIASQKGIMQPILLSEMTHQPKEVELITLQGESSCH